MKRSDLIIKLIEHGFVQTVRNPYDPQLLGVEYRKETPDGCFLLVALLRERNRYHAGLISKPAENGDYEWIRGAEEKSIEEGSTSRQVDRFIKGSGGYA